MWSIATFVPAQPNIKLTVFDLDRDITLKPLVRETSSFKKILISTEMSGKMEVIVPEKPADNSAAELRGILFHPRDKADINEGGGGGVNRNFLQVFVQTDALGNHPFSSCLPYKTAHQALLSTTKTRGALSPWCCGHPWYSSEGW